jgi:hypothetical protein
MSLKLKGTDPRIKLHEMPETVRTGGEVLPYDYPHLYQIQAGEWRISYAVEHNHLAILVLEVLNPDGTVRADPARETLTRKMKVKLLDWPEGSPSRDLPPEDLGKKVKIKLLDLVDDVRAEDGPEGPQAGRIRLGDSASGKTPKGKITLFGSEATRQSSTRKAEGDADDEDSARRKITPLDSPTM